jgi:nucleotide-binding universal stress UspA family protein
MSLFMESNDRKELRMNLKKILVPLDNSPLSVETITRLIARKDHFTVPLTLLHVFDPDRISYRGFGKKSHSEIEQEARAQARQFIDEQQAKFAAAGLQTEILIKEGPARETICKLANSGEYQLLVIGRHVDSELRCLLFGQVANYVVHHVQCPVLMV